MSRRVVTVVALALAAPSAASIAAETTNWARGGVQTVRASTVVPPPPSLSGSDPGSPANDNSPRLKGSAQAGSTVRLYKADTAADCISANLAATGPAGDFASPGLQVSVPDDSSTRFRATATDGAGNASSCSSDSLVYVEDSTAPAPPRISETDPPSPANANSIRVKGAAASKPWFLYVAPTAPHSPFTPEAQYLDATVPEFAANPASFESDNSDKPSFVRQAAADPAAVLDHRVAQLRMLKSVDDLVAKVFSALDSAGEANDTLAFFVSDNGFMWGEHGLEGKPWPYTHSAKIPFYARWPSRLGGGVDDQRIVANVDVAPTIMDATGLSADPSIDGMSLLEGGSRQAIFLESLFGPAGFGVPVRTWASTRTSSYQYTEWYGDELLTPDDQPVFREYYDLVADPWELTNYLGDADPGNDPPTATIDALHDQLASDLTCAGRGDVAGRPACGPPRSPPAPGGQDRPNVLLIVTDDQRPTDTLGVMPRTRELFDDQGTYFPNAFATTPLCCPSRASILTGRYAHNHGVKAGPYAPLLDQDSTIERRLQEAGYRTGIYGKFFAGWDLTVNPSHFDQWSIFNNSRYTGFKTNEQGRMKTIAQYATSYVADQAAKFIRQQQDDESSTVRLYRAPTRADCTPGNLAATGSPADLASPGLDLSVPDDSTTTFRATATDAAGNRSECSFSSVHYTEDSSVPGAPELTDTDPDSPANHNSPSIRGTAETGSAVRLYTTADCSGPAAVTGSARELAFPGFELSVPDDSTTTLHATASDEAGNASGCSSSSITYVEDSINQVEDSTAPAPPVLDGTDPASPANDNSPRVRGTAETGSAVRLYKTADCSGAAVAFGSADELASSGLEPSVPDNSTTTLRGTATDAFDNTSECSTSSITYVEDSSAPLPPALDSTDPDSPANDNSPRVRGTAETGSTVRIYRAALRTECTPANLAATGTEAAFSSSGLAVPLPNDSITTLRATATDAAGNVSSTTDFFGNTAPCSWSSIVYTEDSTPPALPSLTGTDPASPANDNSPKVKGTAEAGSTVRLYKAATTAGCRPANLVATGSAADYASPGLTVSVSDNSATRLRATASDDAGNSSSCSTSTETYKEDSTPPPGPTFSGTDPASPANNNSPKVKGTAQAGSTVSLYKASTTADCTPANLAATGSAADYASPGLTVSVPDNSTTRFRATAIDAAGNRSVCSAGSRTYVESSTLASMAITAPFTAVSLMPAPRSLSIAP